MDKVFKDIRNMGATDPLVIELNRQQFFKVDGFGTCCLAGVSLDKNIFNEGRHIQKPNSLYYCMIKSVWPAIKYSQFEIK